MRALNSFCGPFDELDLASIDLTSIDELSLAFALFAFSQDGSLQLAPNRGSL
jgi:ABC-type maltose transport system permease subunit